MCIEATQQDSVLPAMHAGVTLSTRSPRGRARCACKQEQYQASSAGMTQHPETPSSPAWLKDCLNSVSRACAKVHLTVFRSYADKSPGEPKWICASTWQGLLLMSLHEEDSWLKLLH